MRQPLALAVVATAATRLCHAVDVRHATSSPRGSSSSAIRRRCEKTDPPDARRLYHETWSAGARRRPLWGLITISTS